MGSALNLTLTLIELILKHGPSAAITLIRGLETNNPTPEQIRALKIKAPNTYLENEDE